MNIASLQIVPSQITLGSAAQLKVAVDKPAPNGGATVVLNYQMNGSSDTLAYEVQSIPIHQGARDGEITLQTRIIQGAASSITVTATITGGAPRSATLRIV